MPATERNVQVDIKRRERTNDERGGWIHEHHIVVESDVWCAISPTLGGGRRERQLFGPTIEFEMNAMGIFQNGTDVRITDMVPVKGSNDEYEVLAVVNSMYKGKKKFAALKSKPDIPGKPSS